MSIFNIFKKEQLPYVEDYYTNATLTAGYVIVVSRDKIKHGSDISRSHDKRLEAILYDIDSNFSGLNNHSKVTWHEKQEEGYLLFRLTKLDFSVVYMPDELSSFQMDMLEDIIKQMEDYASKCNKNIMLVVSDLEQGELVISLSEFRQYYENKKNCKHK